jgi:hypothetical protein
MPSAICPELAAQPVIGLHRHQQARRLHMLKRATKKKRKMETKHAVLAYLILWRARSGPSAAPVRPAARI